MYQSFEVEHEFSVRGFAMKSCSAGGGFRHMIVLAAAGTLNLVLMAGPAHAQTSAGDRSSAIRFTRRSGDHG
jgi:hypothetical protein